MAQQSQTVALTDYRFICVNDAGHVTSLSWAPCADDFEARSLAAALAGEGLFIEVWDVGRKVGFLGGDDRPR